MQVVRNSVKKMYCLNPALVSDADVEDYITRRGKGLVCEIDEVIVSFSIADLKDHTVRALFIHADYEGQGIGKVLHRLMMEWYFSRSTEDVWLSTAPHSRAKGFYKKAGWTETGTCGKGELKFEMTQEQWLAIRRAVS